MDQLHSSRQADESSSSSSPRDIKIPKVVVDEEIPSRSYYSSHINIEPGMNGSPCNISYITQFSETWTFFI